MDCQYALSILSCQCRRRCHGVAAMGGYDFLVGFKAAAICDQSLCNILRTEEGDLRPTRAVRAGYDQDALGIDSHLAEVARMEVQVVE